MSLSPKYPLQQKYDESAAEEEEVKGRKGGDDKEKKERGTAGFIGKGFWALLNRRSGGDGFGRLRSDEGIVWTQHEIELTNKVMNEKKEKEGREGRKMRRRRKKENNNNNKMMLKPSWSRGGRSVRDEVSSNCRGDRGSTSASPTNHSLTKRRPSVQDE